MTVFTYSAIIVSLAAVLSYLNHRFVKMESTIAMMGSALLISLVMLIATHSGYPVVQHQLQHFVKELHFRDLVMNIMLGVLLFAGALSINISSLKQQLIEIGALVFVSTIASAFLNGFLLYSVLHLFGLNVAFVYCMLFGCLISPTDPIAVLAIFSQLGAPKKLETIVLCESLFNDGVGVVLFLTTASVAFGGVPATWHSVIGLFLREAVGGVFFGVILGWIVYHLLKAIQDSKVEILLTIATVFGGYTLAQNLEVSGPLAMVATGIFLANYRDKTGFSLKNRVELHEFWELADDLFNIIVFLILGLEILEVPFDWVTLAVAVTIVPLVLLVRYLTVALPMGLMIPWRKPIPYTITILSWGGLRGGLAVALALSIPAGPVRDLILPLTYAVVLFAILVQGTTIKHFVHLAKRRVENNKIAH